MSNSMDLHDLRNVSVDELTQRLATLRGEYAALREAVRLGKEKNHARLKSARAAIAQVSTVLREQHENSLLKK